jgi:hypothetical protein
MAVMVTTDLCFEVLIEMERGSTSCLRPGYTVTSSLLTCFTRKTWQLLLVFSEKGKKSMSKRLHM